jgi:hypothetical protein
MDSPEREDQRLRVFLDEKWVEFALELRTEVTVGPAGFLRYRI